MNQQLGRLRVTPNLSSNTLFHFTSSLDILELILTNGFQARWIYEKLPGRKIAYFTKTVCFCDIPLGLVKEHINWYGTYAIGINRPAARNHGVSPVMYIHSNSPKLPKGSSKRTISWFQDFQFSNYLKQVKGQQIFINEDGTVEWKWKIFYNEREWRYFPADVYVEIVKYNDEQELLHRRSELNEQENHSFLKFDPNTIEYILIHNSQELSRLMKLLKTPIYTEYFESMLTKVITYKQIRDDF